AFFSGASVNGSVVTVNLTGVTNAQTLMINLVGVHQGPNTGNISIPMGVLLADVDSSRRVDSGDVTPVRQQALQPIDGSNFRDDIDVSGRIDSNDVTLARQEAQKLSSL